MREENATETTCRISSFPLKCRKFYTKHVLFCEFSLQWNENWVKNRTFSILENEKKTSRIWNNSVHCLFYFFILYSVDRGTSKWIKVENLQHALRKYLNNKKKVKKNKLLFNTGLKPKWITIIGLLSSTIGLSKWKKEMSANIKSHYNTKFKWILTPTIKSLNFLLLQGL